MTQNISKIETLLERADEIGVKAPLAASITWSYSMTLVNTVALLRRMDDLDDPYFGTRGRMDDEQVAERRGNVEKRIERLNDIVAWANSMAHPDYRPTGEDVVALALDTTRQNDHTPEDELVKSFAESMGVDEATATKALEASEEEFARRRELQRKMIANDRSGFVRAVDAALACYPSDAFEVDERDAARIAERIAEKCETYHDNRMQRAAMTRRRRRMAQYGAECRLLEAVMNDADELSARWYTEWENRSSDEPGQQAA